MLSLSYFMPAFVPRAHAMNVPKYEKLDEYKALATKIGLAPPDTTAEQFRAFLSERKIPIYDLAKVVRYMDRKAARHNINKSGWFWRPLRTKDIGIMRSKDIDFGKQSRRGGRYVYSDYYTSDALYSRRLPFHALERIGLIEDEFKQSIAFLASDYANPAPDPFLMAVTAENRLVIDFWNEPGFGLPKAK